MELPERAPLGSVGDVVLDRVAQDVGRRLHVPVALVSFVDRDGQVFPGQFGLPDPWATERGTPLSHSFCQHVVTDGAPLVVENAHDNPRVADNEAVLDLGVVAYAGMPLTHSGSVIGALCAIDHRPRAWSDDDLATLEGMAADCSAELGHRIQRAG